MKKISYSVLPKLNRHLIFVSVKFQFRTFQDSVDVLPMQNFSSKLSCLSVYSDVYNFFSLKVLS